MESPATRTARIAYSSLGRQTFNISMAAIESKARPDRVNNDRWRESMALVRIHVLF